MGGTNRLQKGIGKGSLFLGFLRWAVLIQQSVSEQVCHVS